MGVHRLAQVCRNGHVPTNAADTSPDLREKFCSACAEPNIACCLSCAASIRGRYHVEGLIDPGPYASPAHCHNCRESFPWTVRKVESAVELVAVDDRLNDAELVQLRVDLAELTKDTPEMQVALLRFKRAMGKASSSVAQGVRDLDVDVLSEAAKKSLRGA